jgi:hypothetical protein
VSSAKKYGKENFQNASPVIARYEELIIPKIKGKKDPRVLRIMIGNYLSRY